MTESEYQMLVEYINELGLDSGKVMKSNGTWYIEGERAVVPMPIINLPHWVEHDDSQPVIIEHRQ